MNLNCPTPGCTRTMPGHLTVCRACSTRLLRDLADVPSLASHLDVALARQTHMGEHGGSRSTETALPWDQRAREAQAVLRSALHGWVHVLSDGVHPMAGPTCRMCEHRSCVYIDLGRGPTDTLPGMARWLLRHRAQLLGRAYTPEAVDEITDAVRQARRAIDLPPGLWYAGPCGVNQCDADLYARHGARIIRCRACHASHDTAAREAWLMGQVADRTATAVEIARALHGFHPGLTPEMIRGYAGRMRLFPSGADALGRPRYRIGDVRDLLAGLPPRPLHGPACTACRHLSCRAIRGRVAAWMPGNGQLSSRA